MTNTIGNYLANVRIRGIDDGIGLPNVVNSFQITPTGAQIELLRGNPGGPGPQGDPAWPWKWQGDIADHAALNALAESQLGAEQKGYAYRVVSDNSVMYWDGVEFYPFVNAFGAEGRQGPPNVLTPGSVQTGPEGSEVVVTITGESPNQVLNITIPRGGQGEKGEPGGPGPILQAADVDGSVTPGQDYVLSWDTATQKWRPVPYPGWKGPWGVASGNITSGSNISTAKTTVATLTVPPQSTAWRPYVEGQLSCQSHVQTLGEARVDVFCRIGSDTGQVVAVGPGFPSADYFFSRLGPNFQTAITPDSNVGVIPANQTATLHFVVERSGAARNYSISNSGGYFIVWAQPVYTP